ncbi:hypothetical protein Tco_0518188 [Tanacetum coccineum]
MGISEKTEINHVRTIEGALFQAKSGVVLPRRWKMGRGRKAYKLTDVLGTCGNFIVERDEKVLLGYYFGFPYQDLVGSQEVLSDLAVVDVYGLENEDTLRPMHHNEEYKKKILQ